MEQAWLSPAHTTCLQMMGIELPSSASLTWRIWKVETEANRQLGMCSWILVQYATAVFGHEAPIWLICSPARRMCALCQMSACRWVQKRWGSLRQFSYIGLSLHCRAKQFMTQKTTQVAKVVRGLGLGKAQQKVFFWTLYCVKQLWKVHNSKRKAQFGKLKIGPSNSFQQWILEHHREYSQLEKYPYDNTNSCNSNVRATRSNTTEIFFFFLEVWNSWKQNLVYKWRALFFCFWSLVMFSKSLEQSFSQK